MGIRNENWLKSIHKKIGLKNSNDYGKYLEKKDLIFHSSRFFKPKNWLFTVHIHIYEHENREPNQVKRWVCVEMLVANEIDITCIPFDESFTESHRSLCVFFFSSPFHFAIPLCTYSWACNVQFYRVISYDNQCVTNLTWMFVTALQN